MILICVLFGFSLAKAFLRLFLLIRLIWKIVLRKCRWQSTSTILNHVEKDVFCAQWSRILFLKVVLSLWYTGYFLFLAVGKIWKQQEDNGLNKDEIKKQQIESIIINNASKIDNLNELDEKLQKPKEATDIIKPYEKILQTKRKDIISIVFYQGNVSKRFKEKEKFTQMVSKLKIHKSTLIFKTNVFKLIEKYPKLMKSSVTLTFLKYYFKDINQICKGNLSEFE